MKILLVRYGGAGDNLFLTPVARELKKQGYIVDVATNERGIEVLTGNPDIHKLILLKRIPPYNTNNIGHPLNLYEDGGVWLPLDALYKTYPSTSINRNYNVIDYYSVIENCSLHKELQATQISDQINTYDMHLAWAGINPDVDKSPVYKVLPKEAEEAKRILNGIDDLIMVQTLASSPARSINPMPIVDMLKGKNVMVWDGTQWILNGSSVKSDIPGFRLSGALLQHCKLLISADTCISHIAEALGTKHITFYTTVPAWTRSKYYKHEITLDSNYQYNGHQCKCCIIHRDCPIMQKNAFTKLSKRDKELIGLIPLNHPVRQQLPIPAGHKFEAKDPLSYFALASLAALNQAIDAAMRNLDVNRQTQAPCIATIDIKRALDDIAR